MEPTGLRGVKRKLDFDSTGSCEERVESPKFRKRNISRKLNFCSIELTELPPEIIKHIFSFLSIRDLLAMSLVMREISDLGKLIRTSDLDSPEFERSMVFHGYLSQGHLAEFKVKLLQLPNNPTSSDIERQIVRQGKVRLTDIFRQKLQVQPALQSMDWQPVEGCSTDTSATHELMGDPQALFDFCDRSIPSDVDYDRLERWQSFLRKQAFTVIEMNAMERLALRYGDCGSDTLRLISLGRRFATALVRLEISSADCPIESLKGRREYATQVLQEGLRLWELAIVNRNAEALLMIRLFDQGLLMMETPRHMAACFKAINCSERSVCALSLRSRVGGVWIYSQRSEGKLVRGQVRPLSVEELKQKTANQGIYLHASKTIVDSKQVCFQ